MSNRDWRPTAFVETAPGVVTEEEAETSRSDQRRVMYEFLRHVMTLDAVALVLTATLIARAFAQPVRRASVGIAVLLFLFSLMAGAVTHFKLLANQPRAGAPQMSSSDLRFYMMSAMLAVSSFILGMVLLATFFWANWFR